MAYLWVALGGAIGSAFRHWCAVTALRLWGDAFPWGTLLINIAGSFVIGIAAGKTGLSDNARYFLMAGICGGFTTFSAFSLQTLELARGGEMMRACAYVAASVLLCVAAVWAGFAVSR